MNKKIFFTLLMISLFLIAFCSYSFADNSTMNNARDSVMKAGNSVGNAITGATNAVVNGSKSLTNGAASIGNDAMTGARDLGNDASNTVDTMAGMMDNNNGNYTATRTATNNNNLLGMSDTTWTWLILGIVGAAIVGLVWYYGKQYEHRNYSND